MQIQNGLSRDLYHDASVYDKAYFVIPFPNSMSLCVCVDSVMTDVQTVTIDLSVLVCLWKITDLISESNYLPLWERLQHAVAMLPQ